MSTKFIYMTFAALFAGVFGLFKTSEVSQKLPSFSGATEWFNTKPLTPADLRGKVVLVEFWTYTCINWRRTLPYVRAWAEKYKDMGLVVIGVHTPEFSFEKNADNVRWAIGDMKIGFPVAMDNDYAIWNAFGNEYWPALFFVDAKGRIRHHQFGEGNYDESEKFIQKLLAEGGTGNAGKELSAVKEGKDRSPVNEVKDLSSVNASGVEAAADLSTLGSPENYLGYERTLDFMSPEGPVADRRQHYTVPAQLRLNEWALAGFWTMGRESDVVNEAGGKLVYRFHARDVNLIMGPAKPGSALRFRVSIDGKAPGNARGIDVDQEGNGTVTGQRMYQLIRQPAPITDREFTIEFTDPGAEVFDFTFG